MERDIDRQKKFEQCVEACADSLFRVAFRLTGDRTLAGELVQETYLNAWRSIESLKDTDKMRGWMFAILRNQYSKLMRVESRSANTAEHLDEIASSPQKDNELQDIVQSAIASLDDNHRMPVLLVSMEGVSVDEAAEVLGVPRGTVLSRLHRGRQKLKEILVRQKAQLPLVKAKEVGDGK